MRSWLSGDGIKIGVSSLLFVCLFRSFFGHVVVSFWVELAFRLLVIKPFNGSPSKDGTGCCKGYGIHTGSQPGRSSGAAAHQEEDEKDGNGNAYQPQHAPTQGTFLRLTIKENSHTVLSLFCCQLGHRLSAVAKPLQLSATWNWRA